MVIKLDIPQIYQRCIGARWGLSAFLILNLKRGFEPKVILEVATEVSANPRVDLVSWGVAASRGRWGWSTPVFVWGHGGLEVIADDALSAFFVYAVGLPVLEGGAWVADAEGVAGAHFDPEVWRLVFHCFDGFGFEDNLVALACAWESVRLASPLWNYNYG